MRELAEALLHRVTAHREVAGQLSAKFAAVRRLAAVILGVAAILSTYADTASKKPINPFNVFGLFTM